MIQRSCAIAALLALFLQGSGVLHMLLVEHVRCAEHGELIHASEPHDRAPVAQTRHDRAAVERVSHGSPETAHAHCPVSSQRREALARFRPVMVALAIRGPASPWAILDRQAALDGPSRLRIAPKNSPPA